MDVLVYLLFWGVGLFLMSRLGCAGHREGRVQGGAGSSAERTPAAFGDLRWLPPPTDVDPVCGRTVDTATAKTSVRDGWVYYFCSGECRERFEAAAASERPEPAVRPGSVLPEHRHA